MILESFFPHKYIYFNYFKYILFVSLLAYLSSILILL